MGLIGTALSFLAMRGGARKEPSAGGKAPKREVDRLMTEIGRGLRALSVPNRLGGIVLLREKHFEVERQLTELQRRLSRLEEGERERYEDRAQRILEQAARYGITLPPP